MKNKQTAVEWFTEELKDKLGHIVINQDWKLFDEIIDRAKEMEKQQIMDAFKHGELPPLFVNSNAEQYYNETFEQEQ